MAGFGNNFNALPPGIAFAEPGLGVGQYPALTPGAPAVLEGASPFAANFPDTLRELPKIGPRSDRPFALGPFRHRPTPTKKRLDAKFHLEALTVILRQGFCSEADEGRGELIIHSAGSRGFRAAVELHIQIVHRGGSFLEKRRLVNLLQESGWLKKMEKSTVPRLRFRIRGQAWLVENWKDGQIEVGRGTHMGDGRWSLAGDSAVSRRHAALLLKGGSVCLMDLEGPNGTALNGVRLRPGEIRPLKRGDTIRMGETDLVLEGGAGVFDAPPSPVSSGRYRALLLEDLKGDIKRVHREGIPVNSDGKFVTSRFSPEVFFYWENGRLWVVDRRKNRNGEILVPLFVNGIKKITPNQPFSLSEGDIIHFWGERLLVLFAGPADGRRRRERVEERKRVRRPWPGREEEPLAEAPEEAAGLEETPQIPS